MYLYVKVKAGASKDEIQNFGDNRYLVYMKTRAEDGKANIELLKMLAKYTGTPSSHMSIKSGFTSNQKIIELK